MANETVLTITGNLTADPELRFTQSGAAVADFTIANTPRTYDKASGQWKDGDTLFMRCSVWREAAENVAESLRKGMRVIVQGRLTQRSYETQQGERRTLVELQVDEIGPSLRNAKAQVTRTSQQPGINAFSGQPLQQPQASFNAPAGGTPSDPWATNQPTNTPMPQGQTTPFENIYGDQPPF